MSENKTKAELEAEAEAAGLSTEGTKAELEERIEQSGVRDQNKPDVFVAGQDEIKNQDEGPQPFNAGQ